MSFNSEKTSNTDVVWLKVLLAVVFVLLISVTIIIRIRTLNVPIDRDVGEYAYAGQLILQGVPPYSLAYNMKMPGIYAAYALILAIFGQTHFGIHTAILIINTATIILLFFLTKKLLGPIAGLASAVFFAITSISNNVQPTANAENFVVLFAIAGIIFLINFTDSKKYLSLTAGGILLGIAFMMKQHGAGFILFGFLFLLWNQLFNKPLKWKNTISVISVYCLCVILPFLLTCLIMWYCGVFEKFWFWTFKYARYYVTIIPPESAIKTLKVVLMEIIPSAPLVWILALPGLLSIIWNRKIRKHSIFLICFPVCSFLAVCPGFYFRYHYFLLFLPALTILAAVGIIAINDLLGLVIKSSVKTAFISVLLILTVWLHSFYCQKDYLLESDPVKISRANFGSFPFPEALEIAKFIKNRSSSNDKIAVLGSEPQIYFYSQRRSATSYIYTYPLMEPQPYALNMQQEMIEQIEKAKPKFVVVVNCYDSWLILSNSEKSIFHWIKEYIPSHYKKIALVEIISPEKTVYHWDSDVDPTIQDGWIMIGERID